MPCSDDSLLRDRTRNWRAERFSRFSSRDRKLRWRKLMERWITVAVGREWAGFHSDNNVAMYECIEWWPCRLGVVVR